MYCILQKFMQIVSAPINLLKTTEAKSSGKPREEKPAAAAMSSTNSTKSTEEKPAAAMSSSLNQVTGTFRYVLFDRLTLLLIMNTTLVLRFPYSHEYEPTNLFISRLLNFNISYLLYEVILSCYHLYVAGDLVKEENMSSSLVERGLGDLVWKHLIVIIAMSLASSTNVFVVAYAILGAQIVRDMLNLMYLYIDEISEAYTSPLRSGSGCVIVANTIASIKPYFEANTIASIKPYFEALSSLARNSLSGDAHRMREVEEAWALVAFTCLAFMGWRRVLLLLMMIEIGCSVFEHLDIRGVGSRCEGSCRNIARMLRDLANALDRASIESSMEHACADDGELKVMESLNSSVQSVTTTVIVDMENSAQSVEASASSEESKEIESTDHSSVRSVAVEASASSEESEEIESTDHSSVQSGAASVPKLESERSALLGADKDWIVVEEDEDLLQN